MKKIMFSAIPIGIFLFLCPLLVWADNTNLNDYAQTGLSITTVATTFVAMACKIAGICLMLSSVIQYWQHRRNPLQVRLSTPVFLLVMGIILFSVPYIVSGPSVPAVNTQY